MSKNGITIADNVKKFAEKNNVSDEEIMKAIHTTEDKMKLFYKGEGFMSFAQLETVAKMMNVTVMDLLEGTEA